MLIFETLSPSDKQKLMTHIKGAASFEAMTDLQREYLAWIVEKHHELAAKYDGYVIDYSKVPSSKSIGTIGKPCIRKDYSLIEPICNSHEGTAQSTANDRRNENMTNKDFKKELEGLKDGGQFFKPQTGTTKITFMDDGGDKYMKDFGDGKSMERVDFKVLVNNEDKTWSVGVGGKNSLYGQIIKIGAHVGHLKGETISLIKKGQGMETDYTIIEAANIPDESAKK